MAVLVTVRSLTFCLGLGTFTYTIRQIYEFSLFLFYLGDRLSYCPIIVTASLKKLVLAQSQPKNAVF
ncbi:MAG: hypothetical protein H0U45_09050 [Tatlockia sp.]|nr:hypothetical protein [Tatlockia sp.]